MCWWIVFGIQEADQGVVACQVDLGDWEGGRGRGEDGLDGEGFVNEEGVFGHGDVDCEDLRFVSVFVFGFLGIGWGIIRTCVWLWALGSWRCCVMVFGR